MIMNNITSKHFLYLSISRSRRNLTKNCSICCSLTSCSHNADFIKNYSNGGSKFTVMIIIIIVAIPDSEIQCLKILSLC